MASMGEEGAHAEQELIEKATTLLWSLLSAAKSVGEDDAARLSEIMTTVNKGLGAVMLLAKERGDNLSEEITLLSELETDAVAWVEEIKKKRDELKAKVASLRIDQIKLNQALLDQTSCPRLPKSTHGDDNYSCDDKK